MERAEARKKHEVDVGHVEPRPSKRRRSNSSNKKTENPDSAMDASSADETLAEAQNIITRNIFFPFGTKTQKIFIFQEFRFPKHKKHRVAEYLGTG